MMNIHFSKYHGTGNDFIIIDNRLMNWEPNAQQVSSLCDRHSGIGADGLMLLSEKSGFDFAMSYFNSDGNESTMCGNGGRCMVSFARSLGLSASVARFWAVDGPHKAETVETRPEPIYRLRMKDTRIGKIYSDGIFIDTGSPHFVIFVEDAGSTDVYNLGKALRHDQRFAPGGTNVDFAEQRGESLFVRSYERGVENETLSCGTGVTASCLANAYRSNANPGLCHVKTLGGSLAVRFSRTGELFTGIWLEGPAKFVFRGEAEVK